MIKIINNKYKIGIIFCGGCNPLFDREKLFNDIINKYEDTCDFYSYSENDNYNLVLLINGCSSECLMSNDYDNKLFVIDDPKLIEDHNFPLNSKSSLL